MTPDEILKKQQQREQVARQLFWCFCRTMEFLGHTPEFNSLFFDHLSEPIKKHYYKQAEEAMDLVEPMFNP
jgi:hypothetical protein